MLLRIPINICEKEIRLINYMFSIKARPSRVCVAYLVKRLQQRACRMNLTSDSFITNCSRLIYNEIQRVSQKSMGFSLERTTNKKVCRILQNCILREVLKTVK